ncbi:MAG: penicillin-binding protein 2, partial [Lachnospiraceae bacterium]|nr:penicillin-binding protein 2 [Lachnospiraceae bacterium]
AYEPGSTTKAMTVAAALDEAKIKTNSGFECNGGELVGGWMIKCNNGRAHGWQNLTEVLGNSCNDALMYIGGLLGRHEMSRYQIIFGFGQKTGVDLPGEATGILYAEENMNVSTVATNAFGQNMNVTMLQQIAAYCSLINGGTYYEPHVVRQIKNSNGAVLEEMDGEAVRQTISADTSRYILDALLDVVDVYTGKNAQIDGYEVWGKTGTAERQGRNKNDYLLSFIGGVPADDPEIVLYVIVDAPQGVDDQARSAHASTLWREIMTDLLPYMNLYPTRELKNPPEETTEGPTVSPEVETDENGNPVTTEAQTAVYEEEDDFSGGIFTDPNAEPEGEADPENE